MFLQNVNPAELSPNPWNTNQVGPDNMERLTASLERHGWVKPVLARRTDDGLQILGGQHRVEAAISLGHDTVPVIILEDVSDDRAKEIGLIDNARYGEDDAIGLSELLSELGGAGQMAEFLPISDAELAMLGTQMDEDDIDDLLGETDTRPDPEPSRPVKTHQVMRFKVPLADVDEVTEFFERIMREQGFTESDSLTNAGDALTWAAHRFAHALDDVFETEDVE